MKTSPAETDIALSLASAVITTSPFPPLLLDRDLHVVACSASFCDAFGLDVGTLAACSFLELGAGEWGIPALRTLLMETAAGGSQIKAYAIDHQAPEGPSAGYS